jgi:NDP-sugar pyrophosphorylase family protein
VLPKPLIPIGETPVIEHIMEKFSSFGFSHFIYTLNYKKEYIKAYLRELEHPFTIETIEEPDFLGTAGSLSLVKDRVSEAFFVTNCDSIVELDFENLLEWHKQQGASMTLVGCHKEVQVPFGVLELRNGELHAIQEKPVFDFTINTGLYVLEPSVINEISASEPLDMNTLIEKVAAKKKVSVYPIREKWFDVGEWERYQESVKKLVSSE